MLAFLPLLQQVLLEYITRRSHKHNFILNFSGLGLMALSVILAFVMLIFLLLALQSYVEALYGEPKAWLLTAASAFLLAFACYIAGHISRKKNGLISKVKEEVQDTLTPVAQLIEELVAPVKDHPLAAVALAALAGVLAGDKLGKSGDKNGDEDK